MDVAIQERVAQKENELNATYDERIHNYEERYAQTPLFFKLLLKVMSGSRIYYVKSHS